MGIMLTGLIANKTHEREEQLNMRSPALASHSLLPSQAEENKSTTIKQAPSSQNYKHMCNRALIKSARVCVYVCVCVCVCLSVCVSVCVCVCVRVWCGRVIIVVRV